MLLTLVSVTLLHAASISPQTVPAKGYQEAIITMDRAARVVIKAHSASGTSCELVDHVQGPFQSAGVAGRTNCTIDALLDAGTYKLRLISKRKGKGNVTLTVAEYTELNPSPVKLEPRREVKQELRSQQQASFWLAIDKRQPVTIRVSGRYAGEVRLWKNGEWLEALEARDTSPRPRAGQPIYEWWYESVLEPGNYLLTAYGTGPRPWTESGDDPSLVVSYGFPLGTADRSATVTIPNHGLATLELPKKGVAVFVSRDNASKSTARLSIHGIDESGATNLFSSAEGTCSIESKALVPECSVIARNDSRHVLLLRGDPGTQLTVQWAPLLTDHWADGAYGASWESQYFTNEKRGDFLIALHETPIDIDSAPLGCVLEEEISQNSWSEKARDIVKVASDRPLRRQFNYDGYSSVVWVDIQRSESYLFATSGDRKNRCELYRVDGEKRTRLTETKPEAITCSVRQNVTPGRYELRIYGGTEGIETITVAQEGLKPQNDTPGKSGCTFTSVGLFASNYRVVSTRATAGSLRALYVRPLPLTLSEPLSLILDGKQTLKFPVTAGRNLELRSTGGEPFSCALGGAKSDAKSGLCVVSGGSGELQLTNPGNTSISISLRRASPPPPALPPLVAFSPKIAPLPVIDAGAPLWFDFDRSQSHAAVFNVKDAGLYNVTTVGLLATTCRIRTPVIQSVGAATGGGRGRNCLVSTYLRPGRYLLDVTTTGHSKGRGGLMLERRSPKSAESVSSDNEVFFRADANDLIQQRLNVTRTAEYTLSTAAQAGSLQCRLDDKQGWPIVRVPIPCTTNMRIGKGSYLWTQLPLTVESMRRTSLERVLPTVTLKGNKVHALAFNRWHRAELGKDGKDEFSFELPADLDVAFALTHGMQGRLYQVAADGKLKPVEVLPAMTPAETQPQNRARIPEQSYQPPPSEDESYGEEEEGSYREDEGSYEEESPPPEEEETSEYTEEAPAQESLPDANAPAPSGKSLSLKAGKYRLIAEHSRGDVGITYALYLRTDTFAPGIERAVDAPGSYTLRVPADGTLRLFTRGNTDVRCRIFDGAGALVVESADRGADWNCGLAEPLRAGDYTLVLESETQVPGETRVQVALAKVNDAGELKANAPVKLDTSVQRFRLPNVVGEGVEELRFTSGVPFSCALEDDKGAVVTRQTNVKDCLIMLRPRGEAFGVRLWTLGNSAQLTSTSALRPAEQWSGGAVKTGSAAIVKLERAGRYQTGGLVYCAPEASRGLMRRCGPTASLEAGTYVFSGTGSSETRLSTTEVVDAVDKPKTERTSLSGDVSLLRQSSSANAIHLLQATVQVGDRSAPVCRIEGGVSQQTDSACFAASRPTTESVARWWTANGSTNDASVTRFSVPFPAGSSPLLPGIQNITWSNGNATKLAMPKESSRVLLSLAEGAWAVQLDASDNPVDLCVPASTLTRCVLTGNGGSVIVYSPAEPRAQAEVLSVEATPRRFALTRLYESNVRAPGQQRVSIPAAQTPRRLVVTGALRCVTTLDDGSRMEGCELNVPPGRAGELSLDVNAGGLRAVLAPHAELNAAELNAGANPSPPDLSAAKALKLSGLVVERSFKLEKDAVVHLRSESGVCGIASGKDVLVVGGNDAGCAFDRLLKAGSYRLVIRGFADRTLTGSASWTQEPVKELTEGIASEESWVAPSQTRFFRFSTASPGRIGLGLQVAAELLDCSVLDSNQRVLGEGCQQFLQLDKGTYLLAVHAPDTARTLKFKPVLVGLAGAKAEVPEDYLRDFFNRIGVQQ